MEQLVSTAAPGKRIAAAPAPQSRWLVGGKARTLVTAAGAGCLEYDGLAVTRWTADRTRQCDGMFIYLRDKENGRVWSAAWQPTGTAADVYEHNFTSRVAAFRRVDHQIECRLEVTLCPNADIELRRCSISNLSDRPRTIEVTSYLEWVLQIAAADLGHPAFSKLFVETQFVANEGTESGMIVARRRPREPEQQVLIGAHWIASVTGRAGDAAIDFETSRMAFIGRGRTLRRPVSLESHGPLGGAVGPVLDPIASLRRQFYLAPGESGVIVFATAARHHGDALEKAAAQVTQENIEGAFEAVELSTPGGESEAEPEHRRQAWADRNIASVDGQRLRVDEAHAARATFQDSYRPIDSAAAWAASAGSVDGKPLEFFNGLGGFGAGGREFVIRLVPDAAGRLQLPPLPWSHVVANPNAGFIATETGAGYAWTVNSRENRLTRWSNDPVTDPHSEALFVRDRKAGVFWSPTPGPVVVDAPCEVRYGFGYADYRRTISAVDQRVLKFVPANDAVTITRVSLLNTAKVDRELDLIYYAQLVLGNESAGQPEHIVTAFDETSGAIFARNPAREHAGRIAFAKLVTPNERATQSFTCDRAEFIGPTGELASPAALRTSADLSGRSGPGMDPCAALATTVTVPAGGVVDYWVLLGEADNEQEVRDLVARYSTAESLDAAFDEVRQFWTDTLSAVQIDTPSRAMNFMVNGWLPYQNLACRLWGRSAYYQSGGAYGFRDQLQDSAAYVYHLPNLTRDQILRNASAQFVEGDVMHWWHPPAGQGIRTRFADDLLWLPLIAAEYCTTTGDHALWDEKCNYLTGPALEPGEAERFITPQRSNKSGAVYDHACRAIDRSLAVGAHGLPLFGAGDWNDGMNRVGRLGRGESVWMGFFLYLVLERMIPVCRQRGDSERATRYRDHQVRLRAALNGPGWDGAWFRRAFFDDGEPLGAATASECQIDALAQAWAVLSGAGDPEFSRKAMHAVERRLVDDRAGLIRLLDPPFNRMSNDPGYIKGYLPGIRENGGQYTHGILWFIRALAELGRGGRAVELLDMINPIHHGDSPEDVAVYQAEPYVVAADVYSQPPNVGRAGWTWYTGSAGWMFRVAVESILGLQVHAGRELVLNPAIAPSWPQFKLRYRLPSGTTYEIVVRNPRGCENGVTSATLDGQPLQVVDGVARVPLHSDAQHHRVELEL